MALDPFFLDFGLNLGKAHLSAKQNELENQAIQASNELAILNGAEQDGYLALNYSESLRQIDNVQLEQAVVALQEEAQAKLQAAFTGNSSASAELTAARKLGKSQAQLQHEADVGYANYKNTQRSLLAQVQSNQRVGVRKPGFFQQVLEAGTQSYLNALNTGRIK